MKKIVIDGVLEDIAHYFTASYSGLNQATLY